MNIKRINRLKDAMASAGLNNILLNSPADIFYYTGYWPSSSSFLIVGKQTTFFSHRIETGACKNVAIEDEKDIIPWLKGKVGFDKNRLSYEEYARLGNKIRLRPAGSIIAGIRAIKEKQEIEAIKRSQNLARKNSPENAVGKKESDVAKKIIFGFVKAGARPSFEPIIASGPNGWHIHHVSTNRRIRQSDLVVVDIGARLDYYCSDRTRTICARPGKREMDLIETVKNIQAQLIDMLHDGAQTRDISNEYARLLEKARQKVLHGWGHSIGLEPHEPIGEQIRKGMTITVEPGIYIKGFGGCRIEDIVLIKRNKAKVL